MGISLGARQAALAAIVCALVAWLGVPTSAEASIDDELKEELEEHLAQFEETDNAEAKQAALMTRALLDGRQAREVLSEHLDDGDDRVKLGAAMGLWLTGDKQAVNTLVEHLADDRRAYMTLREITFVLPDDKQQELVRRLISEGDKKRKQDALRYVAQQHGELYGMLEGYLTNADDELRKAAVQAALFTARDEAAGFAHKMVSSTQQEGIRADGVDLAIGLTRRPGGSSEAEGALEQALDDPSGEIAEKAARHLLQLGHDDAADTLDRRITEAEEDEKKRELARFILDHNATVSKSTAETLKSSEDEQLSELGWQLLAAASPDDIFDELREMFGSTHYDKREIAVQALGHTDKRAIRMLGKALFEGNAEFRHHAAEGLGRIAHKDALPPLKKALNQERDEEVLLEVIDAISRIDEDDSLNMLRFKTTTNNPAIKLGIIKAIRRLGKPEGVRALRVIGQDRNLEIRWEAFVTTLALDRKKGLSRLDSHLRNPPEDFISDIEDLDASVRNKVIAHVLKNGDSETRGRALSAARRIGEPLFDAYREIAASSGAADSVRREALLALAENGAADDLELYERLAQDLRNERLARLAGWTLASQGTAEQEDTFREMFELDDEALTAIAAYGLANVSDDQAKQARTR